MNQAYVLIIVTILVILISGIAAYYVKSMEYQEKHNKAMPFRVFFNGVEKLPSWKVIAVGMLYGLIFGFLDNLFIFFGIDSLEKYMPGGTLTKAGLGNTYSDFVGALVGTYITSIFNNVLKIDQNDIPIWANTVAITIGCLIGLYIPLWITGKK